MRPYKACKCESAPATRRYRYIVEKLIYLQINTATVANLNPRLMLTDLHPFITYVRQLLFECVRMHAKARCALGSRRVLT